MTTLILLLALALIGIALTLAVRAALGGIGRKSEVLAQVSAYGFGNASSERREPNSLQTREIATEIGSRLIDRLGAEQIRELRQLLNSAGYYQTTVTQYLGYRALAAVGLPAVVFLLFILGGGIGIIGFLFTAAAAGIGIILPKTLVEQKAKERTAKIDYEVPELVDLLVTTIEAGLGFGSALQITSRRVREPLGSELRLTLGEQSMGLTMNEALKNMLERTGRSVSMRAFVQAIVQGESMGVSIGKTLRDLAVDMRKRRRQQAEERAQKAPIKLLFPLVFMIFPSMFVVLLGPAIVNILHALSG
jgi:tight adherence protein C